jgi:hypothetical protein
MGCSGARPTSILFYSIVDSTLQWKAHIDLLLVKLNAACYGLRTLKPIVSQQVLVMVYFAYFHSIMSYDIIFWGSSPHCTNIFRLQKKILRLNTNTSKNESCRKLFSNLKILTPLSQYIFPLLCLVCNNKDQFTCNLDIHEKNTRRGSDFHYPTSNLTVYQKSTYYMGLKVFDSLPSYIKVKINDINEFKWLIKNFLYCNTFYTLEEYINYFNHNKNYNTI